MHLDAANAELDAAGGLLSDGNPKAPPKPREGAVGGRAAARGSGPRLRVQLSALLADAPPGSLDFATGETVMKLIFYLNREASTTLVLMTHDSGLARRCERQIRIEAGRIAG